MPWLLGNHSFLSMHRLSTEILCAKCKHSPFAIIWDEGFEISRRQQLEYYPGSRIFSTVDCFAAVCRDRRHHLSPSVGFLKVYLDNQGLVRIYYKTNAEERLNQSRLLEKYFARPQGQEYYNFRCPQYFSLFQKPKRN
jgi:hypothetical protein